MTLAFFARLLREPLPSPPRRYLPWPCAPARDGIQRDAAAADAPSAAWDAAPAPTAANRGGSRHSGGSGPACYDRSSSYAVLVSEASLLEPIVCVPCHGCGASPSVNSCRLRNPCVTARLPITAILVSTLPVGRKPCTVV